MANFNSTTPAAPGSAQNIVFAYSGANVSAYSPVVVGDTGSGGKTGAVPAPGSGDAAAGKYLRADGTWAVPPLQAGLVTDAAYALVTSTALQFHRNGPSYIDQYTAGGSIVVRTTVSAVGDTTVATMTSASIAAAVPLLANKGLATTVRYVSTATDTALVTDHTLLLSATVTTETLPASPNPGQELFLINLSSSPLTISGNGKNIISVGVSSASLTLPALATALLQYDGVSNIVWRHLKSADYSLPIVSKAAAYTVSTADYTVLLNAASAAFTVTLPASPISGQTAVFKKTDASANAVTIGGNGKNIDGASSKSLTTQYQSLRLQYDGSAWWVL